MTNGLNDWNYLPEDGVHRTFAQVEAGEAVCIVAFADDVPDDSSSERMPLGASSVLGLGIYLSSALFPEPFRRFLPDTCLRPVFVAEMCTRRDAVGRGVGSAILSELCLLAARREEADVVLVDRHEENPGSAGMMRKSGFELVATLDDPDKRPTGSRRTSVLIKRL